MARSAALNPASMPFFPGNLRASDDEGDLTFRRHPFRSNDPSRNSFSSVSISPTEYRTARSSPSPPQDDLANMQSTFKSPFDLPRRSPSFHQVDAGRPYPVIENRVSREASLLGSLESLPEGEDSVTTPGPLSHDSSAAIGSPFFPMQQQPRERFSTPPTVPGLNGSSHTIISGPTSSSPVSSLDSGSHLNSGSDGHSFEAQLKASPMLHDILDRLVRCEYSTREIHRDLGELHRKVNILVDRSTATATANNVQPEFKDPFASNGRRPSYVNSMMAPRASLGNIAPNQVPPSDDITSISQRLNTLTSSVGQLIALQTQHVQPTPISGLPNGGLIGPPKAHTSNLDFLSTQQSNANTLGHGLPNRPDMRPSPRIPNPPMRTWSTGTLDLPVRPPETTIGRQEGFPRDKRRSVSNLMRRDSAGMLDPNDSNSPRDSGPMITKWEQLSLAPELQVSLNSFGVGPPNKIQQRALPFLLRGSDIIAQAPPTQERIAAYVIPAIQTALTHSDSLKPVVLMISTTVDQATQAHRMIRDLGSGIGVRSVLAVGAVKDFHAELQLVLSNKPQVVCGTPQKLHALFTTPGGLDGSDVRFLVLDEVDQLIARNMHEFVFNIVKLLPPARSRPPGSVTPTPPGSSSNNSPIPGPPARKMSTLGGTPVSDVEGRSSPQVAEGQQSAERQTALFSNTVPQDVLNLATAIQLKEPVRVLVRRDGTVTNIETSPNFRGLRQFYLYLAFTAGGRSDPSHVEGGLGIIGSGRSTSSAESVQAREWKLDALADILDDVDVAQAIVHVGGVTALDAVVYKLASRGLEAIPLHGDMNSTTKLAALSKFKSSPSVVMRQPVTKILVIYDVHVQEISQIPLIINYDLPKAVEEYTHRIAPAVAPNNYSRGGVIINFVTATGGDVEMLRSIECFHK
ncbi:hypothetical protein EDD85DRAFT_918893 [Armillaria nabsnona]|nr:hypothetical protein EDD85DRAFT_918893 [Armillaria nabsnona]